MTRYMLNNKLLAVAVSLAFCTVFSSEAFAWQGRGQNGWQGSNRNEVQHGMSGRNEVQHGMARHGGDSRAEWHSDGMFWGGVALSALVVGAIIASLPQQHETAYAYSTPAAAEPVVGAQAQGASAGSVEINVPNARGGYTPVTLTQYNTGYIGPQGEYYEGHPTVEQLKALYGQ